MIYTKTPFRVSFFGGGTDFQSYYKKNKSIVIGTSIDKYIYIFMNKFYSNLFNHNLRIFYSKLEFVKKPQLIKHNVIRQIFIKERINKDYEMHLMSELPSYIGLGSSSSFLVGFLKLVNEIKKRKLSKNGLANQAIFTEQNILKEHVGCQDQILATYGGFNSILFNEKKFLVRPITTKFHISDLINNLYLIYTGVQRKASNIENKKFSTNNKNKNNLDYIRDIAFEAYECFKKSNKPDFFGTLLNQTWQYKKKIHKVVSNKIIDEIYNKGRENGACGGKLLGAGAGGFILFYVQKKNQSKFEKSFKNENLIRFNIDYKGSIIKKL